MAELLGINYMKNRSLSYVLMALLYSFQASASPCGDALIAGKYEEAMKHGEMDSSHDGHLCVVRAYLALGKPKDAISRLASVEKLSSTPYERMLTATYQGRAAKAMGDTASAIRHFQQAAALAAESRQKQAQWFNLNELGQIQLEGQDTKSSLESFLKAYTFAANDNERSESDQLIASAYKAQKDLDHAIEYQLKATLLEKRSGELEGYVNTVLELADLRIANNELIAAEKNVKEVVSITSGAKSDYWNARTFHVVAKLELAKGNLDAYRRARDEAKSYADKSGDKALQQLVESLTP